MRRRGEPTTSPTRDSSPHSDDHAILIYTGRAYRAEDEPSFIALMSGVYTRCDGAWRLALYQQTPVPAQEQNRSRTGVQPGP